MGGRVDSLSRSISLHLSTVSATPACLLALMIWHNARCLTLMVTCPIVLFSNQTLSLIPDLLCAQKPGTYWITLPYAASLLLSPAL